MKVAFGDGSLTGKDLLLCFRCAQDGGHNAHVVPCVVWLNFEVNMLVSHGARKIRKWGHCKRHPLLRPELRLLTSLQGPAAPGRDDSLGHPVLCTDTDGACEAMDGCTQKSLCAKGKEMHRRSRSQTNGPRMQPAQGLPLAPPKDLRISMEQHFLGTSIPGVIGALRCGSQVSWQKPAVHCNSGGAGPV